MARKSPAAGGPPHPDRHARPSLLDRFSSWHDGTDLNRVSYLTPLDCGMLYGEDNEHSFFVAGLYTFQGRLDPAVALKCVRDYAMTAKGRMISRIVLNDKSRLGRPFFEIEEDFDPHDHFELVHVPAPGGKPEIEEIVGKLQSRHLGFEHSPWKCFFLEGVDGGSKSAIYWMSHHALADGQGFLRYLLRYVASLDENGDLKEGAEADVHSLEAMQYSAGRFLAGAEEKRPSPPNALLALLHVLLALLSYAYQALVGIALHLGTLLYLLFRALPKRSLRPPPKGLKAKQYAYSAKIPLDALRAAKNALGVTINDLMVTAATAAVDRYLAAKGAAHPRERERIFLIPTSIRKPEDFSLSNQSSGWLLPVGTGYKDRMDRLHGVATRMQLFKKSWEPYTYKSALFPIVMAFPWLFPRIDMSNSYLNSLTGTVTNVPGSKTNLSWAAVPFDQYAPVVCNVAGEIGIAILSLYDHTTAGILIDLDPSAPPSALYAAGDARMLVDFLEEEIRELVRLAKEGGREKKAVEKAVSALPPRDPEGAFRRRLDHIEHHEEGDGVHGVIAGMGSKSKSQ
ncbi:wax ester synthase-like acyl-CoA acyltransferase domain-containing protein [Hyaloraphidium curvatum]|nr:wax ester synthase-like acyl-CoA acyltransferase domain-containing protein [Hyaloraphidium curvatum]